MSDIKIKAVFDELIEAIQKRDRKAIIRILEREGTLPYIDTYFNAETPLSTAVYSGDLNLIELLLTFGADPTQLGNAAIYNAFLMGEDTVFAILKYCTNTNLKEVYNTTLHIAASEGSLNVVEYLLKNGTDPNIPELGKPTALLNACDSNTSTQNMVEICRLLIDHGVNINQEDYSGSGNTPLIMAAFRGNEKIVKLLIENEANLTARNHKGFTALHALLDKKFIQEDTIQLFLDSGIDVDDKSNDGSCLLLSAASNPCSEPFQYLLKCGANINKVFLTGNKILLLACRSGHIKTVEILLKSGLDSYINTKEDYTGHTALHKAVQNANYATEIVKLLLEYEADLNLTDTDDASPLHEASKTSNSKVVKLLLINGANVNIKDKYGFTPLYEACYAKRKEVISELLYYGADINFKRSYGDTELPLNIFNLEDDVFNANECLCIFMAHITLKLFLNEFIDQIVIYSMNQDEIAKDLMNKCYKEIDKMMKTNIGNTSITFYDFLTKCVMNLSKTVGNKNVADVFISELDIIEEFPMYKWYLFRKFSDALDRYKIVNKATVIFQSNIYPLPSICLYNIFDFLSFQDLKNIVKYELKKLIVTDKMAKKIR